MPLFRYPLRISGPSTGPTMVLHLHAEQGVTATHQGYQTGTWEDQSGSGNDFIGNGAAIDHPFPLANALSGETKVAMYFPDWATTWLTHHLGGFIPLTNGLSFLITYKLNFTDTAATQPINAPYTFVSSTTDEKLAFGLNGGNVVYNYKAGSIVSVASSGQTLNNGNVHSIAVTHNTSGTINLYVNGALSNSGSATYDSVGTSVNALGVGYLNQDFVSDWNVGEIIIYNGAVDASVVSAFHTSTVAYWGPF